MFLLDIEGISAADVQTLHMENQARTNSLSAAQVSQFYREGYLVVPSLVSHDVVDKVLEEARKVSLVEGGGWTPKIFDHLKPEQDPRLHHLLIEPAIVNVVEQLFEAQTRVYYGMLAIVPPKGGKGLPWHQDNQYNQILGNALNVFVALDDITSEMAILWVAPGSHKLGVQPSKTNTTTAAGHREAVIEPENGVQLPGLNKGDVCIFDRSTYHRTLTNTTDMPRYAYAAQFMADYSRMAESGEKDPSKMLVSELKRIWDLRS